MAERPVLRGHATFIREGIVCGNAAVGLQPDDLAQILAHVLRRVELLPLARGDEEILAVGRKGEAVREMTAPRHIRVLLPEEFQQTGRASCRERVCQSVWSRLTTG